MRSLKLALTWLFAALFVAAGAAHFARPETYLRAMPGYLPWHRELVAVSGVIEIVLGGLLLWPRWRRPAAWGLVALLIAVFPANIAMALHPERFPAIPPAALWGRLPLQGVLIAWAYWLTRPGRR